MKHNFQESRLQKSILFMLIISVISTLFLGIGFLQQCELEDDIIRETHVYLYAREKFLSNQIEISGISIDFIFESTRLDLNTSKIQIQQSGDILGEFSFNMNMTNLNTLLMEDAGYGGKVYSSSIESENNYNQVSLFINLGNSRLGVGKVVTILFINNLETIPIEFGVDDNIQNGFNQIL